MSHVAPSNLVNFGHFGDADSQKALFFSHEDQKTSIFSLNRVAVPIRTVIETDLSPRRT